jgi:hypothetical protein
MNFIGKQLGFNSVEDWYNITKTDIKYESRDQLIYVTRDNGGSGLLAIYNNSLLQLLKSIFPGEFITSVMNLL